MTKKTKKNNKGFSLVELIIVIAIMAILAGVLAPQFIKYLANSRVTSDIENAKMIGEAVSAQIADDATNGASTFANVQNGISYTGGNYTFAKQQVSGQNGNADIQTVVGGDVKIKADTGYEFFVESNGGTVTVTVEKGASSVQLYPSVKNESGTSWDTSSN